jgi:hypothetical protein
LRQIQREGEASQTAADDQSVEIELWQLGILVLFPVNAIITDLLPVFIRIMPLCLRDMAWTQLHVSTYQKVEHAPIANVGRAPPRQPVGLKENRLQRRLDGSRFAAFSTNRITVGLQSPKSAVTLSLFRSDSSSPTGC